MGRVVEPDRGHWGRGDFDCLVGFSCKTKFVAESIKGLPHSGNRPL